MADPAQVLQVLRDVLLEHMDDEGALPHYRIQSAVRIGRNSGRLITEDDVISGRDVEGGLLLAMRDGSEYRLTFEDAMRRKVEG